MLRGEVTDNPLIFRAKIRPLFAAQTRGRDPSKTKIFGPDPPKKRDPWSFSSVVGGVFIANLS